MKGSRLLIIGAICATSLLACKKENYVGAPDKTANITAPRQWTGTHFGYAKELIPIDGSFKATWFSMKIPDTTFLIEKYDVLTIKVFGLRMRHTATDDVAGTIRFDTTLPQSEPTVLIYNSKTNKITFEYHNVGEWNAGSGHNYEEHFKLETK